MSDLESMREKVLGKYLTEEVEISSKEYKNLSQQEKKRCTSWAGDYFYNVRLDIPPEEMDSFLALKSFEAQMEIRNAIITIKNIVVFIFVLSIIASILLLIIQVQRF